MIHPASELRLGNPVVGYGVFATRFIPKGTITWVFDDLDQILTPDQVSNMSPQLQDAADKYSYLNGRGERVLCWDHSRFINHSCRATSLAPGFDLEIAVRDIEEGEEITDDYGMLNMESELECACGQNGCRRTIGPRDFDLYVGRWDALVAAAFPLLNQVDQPLWDLVREKGEIRRVLAGEALLPSCRLHRTENLHAVKPAGA